VRHLLDGIVDLTANDSSLPRCRGVKGYLHPDLTHIQAMGLKGMATVDGDRPVVAKSHQSAQELSWKPRVVSARGMKTPVLTEGAVG
jgi:hypothetical protein